MSFGIYVILILFGLFVLLLIFNPNLSCFGRTIKFPFQPLFRKKRQRKMKTEDYGFHLVDDRKLNSTASKKKATKVEDYGFHLVEDKKKSPSQGKESRNKRS